MYGIFTYIYHEHQQNVGKYTIHGWYGFGRGSNKGIRSCILRLRILQRQRFCLELLLSHRKT